MAIAINSVKCPECGASLPIEEGRTQVFCSYCGTKVMVTNDNEHIYRHIDETGIKKAELDRDIRMRELDLEQQRVVQGSRLKKIITIVWLALSIIVLGICIVRWAVLGDLENGFLMLFYLAAPIVGGGGYLIFKVIPEKENERNLLRAGGIRFPKGLEPFSEKDYEAIYNALKNAGFNNIICSNMHDVTLGLFQKPGKVESVAVDGDRITSGGKLYSPNVQITITYHGK